MRLRKIPMEEPCNLKSSYPGQIVRLEVISGVTVVEEGDAGHPGTAFGQRCV